MRFLPGQSGNPNGRKAIREDLKNIQLLGEDNARRLIQKLLDMPIGELRLLVADETTPALELLVAKVIERALREGDATRLNFLFDRTVGKVTEKREVEVKPITYRTNVTPDGSLIQEIVEEESLRGTESAPELPNE